MHWQDSRGMDLEEFKALCAEYKDCDGWMRLLLEDVWIAIREFPKIGGTLFWGPYNKDPTI